MLLIPCWRRKQDPRFAPLGGLPERPVLAREMMWNTDQYPHWGHALSTTTTTSLTSYELLAEDPVFTGHYFSTLRRVLLTSDLGTGKHQYHLRFNCIIPGDTPLAMFTTARKPNEMEWFNGPNQGWRFPKLRCCWRNGLRRIQSPCTVRCSINNKWQYKICTRAVIKWDPHWGILLVNHKQLIEDYETQEKCKSNRASVTKMVKQFHKLEEQTLRSSTGGAWANWGDWDIYPATPAEVAQTCRLEGRAFEELLGRSPGSGKRSKIRRCLGDISKGLKRFIST